MRRVRLHVAGVLSPGVLQPLSAESAHYVRHVLRLAPGARLQVFDDEGSEYEASLHAAGKRALAVLPEQALEILPESALAVHFGLGLARGERMDWALQKATELGVASITPLLLERCTAKLAGGREDNRLRHWRQVVASACEQCGRARLPRCFEPLALHDWLARDAQLPGFVLHTRAAARLDASGPRPPGVRVLIGPEGGLSAAEFELAKRAGFIACSLGPRVLRAETAPLAALAILQYLWGDL